MADEMEVLDEETKDAPKIRDNQELKIFRCRNCSSDSDGEKWFSWKESLKESQVSADGKPTKDGRALCKCPECKQSFGIFSLENGINMKVIPKE